MQSDSHDVLEALDKVLDSSIFKRSERQSRFLRFVVEFYLKSPDGSLSSFDIASDCFNRIKTDDPDSTYVRNIASQTRRSLKSYYGKLQQSASLKIQLADKGYRPLFIHTCTSTFEQAKLLTTNYQEQKPEPYSAPHTIRRSPTVAVMPFYCLQGNELLGELMSDSLHSNLSKIQQVQLVPRRNSSLIAIQDSNLTSFQLGKLLGADYVVEGRYYILRDNLSLYLELSRCENDKVIWAEQIRSNVQEIANGTCEMIEEMLRVFSAQVIGLTRSGSTVPQRALLEQEKHPSGSGASARNSAA